MMKLLKERNVWLTTLEDLLKSKELNHQCQDIKDMVDMVKQVYSILTCKPLITILNRITKRIKIHQKKMKRRSLLNLRLELQVEFGY